VSAAHRPARNVVSLRKSREVWPTHLDLENIMVALLTENRAWPAVLKQLGYELRRFDAKVTLPLPTGSAHAHRPDTICYDRVHRRLLVLEAKTGSIVRFDQLPEGRGVPVEEWVKACKVEDVGVTVSVVGMMVAETSLIDSARGELDGRHISGLKVERAGLRLDPDHQTDSRIGPAMARLRDPRWPSNLVPFGHDRGGDWKPLVIQTLAPILIERALAGQEFVQAQSLAQQTHRAIWDWTDTDGQNGLIGVIVDALETLAAGGLKGLVVFDRDVARLKFVQVQAGKKVAPWAISALRQGLRTSLKRVQPPSKRIRNVRPSGHQLGLGFYDDV
jgi:hypothetical protein